MKGCMALIFLILLSCLTTVDGWTVPSIWRKNIAKLFIGINVLNTLPTYADDATAIYTNDRFLLAYLTFPSHSLTQSLNFNRYHTKFSYPKKYVSQQGVIGGDRTVEAFVDPEIPTTSVSIVYTPIPGDFTKISSFGSGKDTIRDYLVPKGNDVESEVLNENLIGIYTYILTVSNC